LRFLLKEAIDDINEGGGHTMQHHLNNRLNGCLTGSQCACGARAADNGDACVKCVSRARWERRKGRRTINVDR
jgi:hypothetical protein